MSSDNPLDQKSLRSPSVIDGSLEDDSHKLCIRTYLLCVEEVRRGCMYMLTAEFNSTCLFFPKVCQVTWSWERMTFTLPELETEKASRAAAGKPSWTRRDESLWNALCQTHGRSGSDGVWMGFHSTILPVDIKLDPICISQELSETRMLENIAVWPPTSVPDTPKPVLQCPWVSFVSQFLPLLIPHVFLQKRSQPMCSFK